MQDTSQLQHHRDRHADKTEGMTNWIIFKQLHQHCLIVIDCIRFEVCMALIITKLYELLADVQSKSIFFFNHVYLFTRGAVEINADN